jgi:Peptidase A4 family
MRKTSRVGLTAAGALAAAVLAGAVTYSPASIAATNPSASGRSAVNASISNSTLTNSVQLATSPDLAGYIAHSGTTTFRLASAHFTIPYLDCKGVTVPVADAMHWVGLGLTEETGVETTCEGTTPVYRAFWAFYPNIHFPSITVGAGNSIQMSVYFNSNTHEYKFSFTDSTNGQQFTRTATCPSTVSCSRHDADAITEAPINTGGTAFLPLADFQATSFVNVHITNTSGTHSGGLESAFWSTARVKMVAETDQSGASLNSTITGTDIPAGTTLANTTSLYNKNTFLVYWSPNNAG